MFPKTPLLLFPLLLVACGTDPVGGGSNEGDALLIGDASGDAEGDFSIDEDTSADTSETGEDSSDAGSDGITIADVTEDVTNELIEVDVVEDATPDVEPDVVEDVVVEPDVPGATVDPTRDTAASIQVLDVRLPLSTGGDIAAKVYLASAISAEMPLVILNHGFQISGDPYASYARRMASHGIITVVPTFGDSLLSARTHTVLAADTQAHVTWAIEQAELAGAALRGRIDVDSIGVAGHSRGGKHSILAAVEDDRIAAVFTLDPVDSGPPFGSNPRDYPSVAPERMDELTIPSAYVGAGRGGVTTFPLSPACAPEDDNYSVYFGSAPSPAYQYVLAEAGHLDFLDACSGFICNTCPAGTDANATRDASRTLMVSFFRYYLADDAAYRPWVDGSGVDALIATTAGLSFTER